MPDRACKATTKAGKPCKAAPLKDSDFCLAHDVERRSETNFCTPEAASKGGKAGRVPKLTELLRERVEERADEILDKLFSGLEAQRAVVVGNGPTAHVEIVDDPDLVLKTIKEIYDRTEGRPKQATEVTGANGGPVSFSEIVASAAAPGDEEE